jgi:anti-sigma B factor antagonist
MGQVRLTTEDIDGVTVVRVEGELDKLAIDQTRSALDRLVSQGRLVVDLDGVTFIDSAGLHSLFGLARLSDPRGGTVALVVGDASPTARVIGFVHLSDVVPVLPTVADAVSALRQVSRDDAAG